MKRLASALVLSLACVPAAAQPERSGAREKTGDLARQERRIAALGEASRSRDLGARDLQLVTKSAADFAAEVAQGDDAAFVLTFRDAFNSAVAVKHPEAAGPGVPDRPDLRNMPTRSVWSDPVLLRNARRLIDEASAAQPADVTPFRIVGGILDDAEGGGMFPDCVAVGHDNGWCCSGTLVAPNVVVTAGHCEGACASRVFVGQSVFGDGETVRVVSAVRHPEYDTERHNDLTVLILERDVTAVQPRPIAPAAALGGAFSVRAVGYGNTNLGGTTGYGIRRLVDIPIATIDCVEPPGCAERYGCDGEYEFVAADAFLNIDTCRGDSGGPVYVEHEGAWYVCGATSRATAESVLPCGDGGIYVRLDKYADWIRSVPGGRWPGADDPIADSPVDDGGTSSKEAPSKR